MNHLPERYRKFRSAFDLMDAKTVVVLLTFCSPNSIEILGPTCTCTRRSDYNPTCCIRCRRPDGPVAEPADRTPHPVRPICLASDCNEYECLLLSTADEAVAWSLCLSNWPNGSSHSNYCSTIDRRQNWWSIETSANCEAWL